MTTPTGTIAMTDVQTEFGGANPIALNEYYAGGLYVSAGISGVPASGTISMNDLRGKANPYYGTLTIAASTRSEGQSFDFTLQGGNIGAGTLYWKTVSYSNLQAADFVSETGSFTVAANSYGTFSIATVSDLYVEGSGTFNVIIGIAPGVPATFITYSGATLTITESVTYTTSAVTNSNPYRIGSDISRTTYIGMSATGVPIGTTIYWDIVNVTGTIDTNDTATLNGSFTLDGSLIGYTNITMNQILTGGTSATIGSKAFKARFYIDASRTIQVGTDTTTITIKASPTYTTSWSPTYISEGQYSTYSITTTNIPNNEVNLSYTTSGSATSMADISAGSSGDLGTIVDNAKSAAFWAYYDGLTEAQESYTVHLHPLNTSIPAVSSTTCYINSATGNIDSVILSKIGGDSMGVPVSVLVQVTSISAYGADRTFEVWQSLNGSAYSYTVQTIFVPALSTSSSNTVVYSVPNTTVLLSSYNVQLRLSGHTDKISNTLSSLYI